MADYAVYSENCGHNFNLELDFRLQRQLKPQGSEADLSMDQYADFCPVQTVAFVSSCLAIQVPCDQIRSDQ